MKYLWMILCLLLCGCLTNDQALELKQQKDKTTVRESYYLRTIVHDDHLFILSTYGYFIHHFDCPCLKRVETKEEHKFDAPSVFLDLINAKK